MTETKNHTLHPWPQRQGRRVASVVTEGTTCCISGHRDRGPHVAAVVTEIGDHTLHQWSQRQGKRVPSAVTETDNDTLQGRHIASVATETGNDTSCISGHRDKKDTLHQWPQRQGTIRVASVATETGNNILHPS